MNSQATARAGGHKRKLPYKTEEELNEAVKAVTIRVGGKYTKRGEQRKEVYEDDYEADIVVPEKFAMGHVKLQVNRYIKEKLKGIRARTFEVDTTVAPKPAEGKFKARDFISHQGILDNESAKRLHLERQRKRELERKMREDGTYQPPEFSDTTNYGDDGLPPVVNEREAFASEGGE